MASGSKFSMSAVLSLVDNMTNPYKKTTSKITALNRSLGGSFGTLNRSIDKVAMGVGRGLRNAAVIGVGALSAGVIKAGKDFIDLDSAITNAGAKFKDLDSGSKTFTKDLKALQTEARKVAKVTEFMATDTAGALDKMAMAGMTSVQSMALLAGTTDLATSAGTDLTTAVDIATDSLGAFGQMTTDTTQLTKNFGVMQDQMAKTTTTANTSLVELFEAVGKGARTFTDAGQSMATFNSFAGVMANATIKGGEAGTALRNVMLRLSKPSGEAAKALDDMGIKTADANGNFRDIVDIIADFEKGLKGMGTQQRTASLSTIFGAKTVNGFNVLLGEGSEKLRKYREDIIKSEGASKKMADAIRNSIGNRIKVLFSGLSELGLKFVEAFETRGRGALNKLITVVQNFDMNIIIDAVNKGIETFKNLTNFIKENKNVILGFITTLAIFKGAIIAVTIAQKAQMLAMAVAPVLSMIKLFMSLAKTEGILATAQLALNTAMSANPVGLIIIGVMALIAVTILLIKNWKVVSSFFGKVGKVIGKFVSKMWNGLMGLLDNPFFTAIGLILAPWLTIPLLIIKNWEQFKTIMIGVGQAVLAVLKFLWDGFMKLLDNPFFTGVALIFAPWLTIPALIIKHWSTIKTFFGNLWEGIKSGAVIVGSFLSNIFTTLAGHIKNIWGTVAPAFEVVGRAIMSFLLAPIQLVISAISGLLTLISKIPGVGNSLKPALDALKGLQGNLGSVTLKGGREKTDNERQEQIESGQQQKASLNDIENEKRQRQQESTQRNDIFLHAPSGAGISDTAGGAPSTAVNIGRQ